MHNLFLLAVLAAFPSPTPVHSFYDQACCGDTSQHCHPVTCGEVNPVAEGWTWRGILFTRQMLHKAPDGDCHVCTHHINFGDPEQPLCIYLPPQI